LLILLNYTYIHGPYPPFLVSNSFVVKDILRTLDPLSSPLSFSNWGAGLEEQGLDTFKRCPREDTVSKYGRILALIIYCQDFEGCQSVAEKRLGYIRTEGSAFALNGT
jgi:hypothetical protein